ncbi:MAG: SH3 domain-containing protein [Anaerolineae bacterium]|nr:SH3 domain-containing protein [Anaerolineae bacterium]
MKSLQFLLPRLGALALVVTLLVTLLPPVEAQGPVADAQVVTTYLNMRAAPDESAPIVQRLTNGTLLTLRGRTEDGVWLLAATSANVTGWVKASWLALRLDLNINSLPISGETVAVSAPASAPGNASLGAAFDPGSYGATATVVTRVNIRSGPGTQHRRLGTLALGVQIGLKGRDASGLWAYGTTSTGITGWVVARYTDVTPAALGSLPVLDASAPSGVSAVAAQAAIPAAQAQPAASGAPAAAPPPPVANPAPSGSFMLGGQVADFSQQGWMQAAGMTWVKRQVTYNNGADPGGQAGLIADAHNRGFRILLSVKGHANELASDPNYLNNFAGYLGGLARLGADAIEVWNEQNIDREWPTGRIDPNWYTQMLAAAYNAIKSNNGSTLVISGAPAPTGAEGWFGSDRVWNDDRYIRGMAAAGAARYMDCVGVHYNAGATAPGQTSGHPGGGHYSWYYRSMVDLYWGAFGGQRPLCFTEIGYLSGEGYGPVPGGFSWAANVTVAQQAQWLAEAARMARNSGRVRLFIVWNVDFTGRWGEDPQGGYAIVRPGGDCPACRALAGIW